MRVVLTSYELFEPAARVVVALLRRLGYRSALHVIPGDASVEAFAAALRLTQPHAGVHVLSVGADYPAAVQLHRQLLSCAAFVPASPDNVNGVASSAARRSTATDARGGERAGDGRADAPTACGRASTSALVDAAPWLPLYNRRVVVLTGKRVGGYRYHPMCGTLLDQLWVR